MQSLPVAEKAYAVITGPTFMKVKRPSLGAEGYVVSHYDRAALDRYLTAVTEKLVTAAPGTLQSIFCDSLEVYNANWTSQLPSEFQKRRGYNILDNFYKLFEEKDVGSSQVRFDFWRTLAELHEEQYTKPLGEWCRKHGVLLEMEEYGTPPAPLTAYQYIDVPTGEQYEWKGFSFSRYAASGAHLAGKRKIGAEAWTWTGIPNRLADSLSDLKLCSDLHFLAGINELTGVDWAYSPRNIPFPGWLPYFGPVMSQQNSQFPYFHYLVEYANRCQYMLQQGKPVAEVALYLPVEDCFVKDNMNQMPLDFRLRDHFVTGKLTGEFGLKNASEHHSNVIHALNTNGYNFDGIDFWTLNRSAKIENGRIHCGDGDYGIVVLHNVKTIENDALTKLGEFVKQGGKLLITGTPPTKVTNDVLEFHGKSAADGRLGLFTRRSNSASVAVEHLGRDSVTFVKGDSEVDISEALRKMQALQSPDLIVTPYQANAVFVHRRTSDTDIYFLSNPSEESMFNIMTLKTAYTSVTEMNPVSGEIIRRRSIGTGKGSSKSQSVVVNLPVRGSTFLIASNQYARGAQPELVGTKQTISFDKLQWTINFTGENAPPPVITSDLSSWTQMPGAKFYSGDAVYKTTLAYSGQEAKRVELQFALVYEVAEVKINGKTVGGIWCPPYSIDVTNALKIGNNQIEIRVGNVMANRYIGMPREDLRPLRAVYGNRFPDPQEKDIMKEPMPSGLIGPMSLRILR